MIKITVFCFTIISSSLAINPPREGAIPDSILSLFRSQGIGNEYGNPGLMKKIQRFKNQNTRDEQININVPVLLGKYSDQSQTYFSCLLYTSPSPRD